MRLLGGTQPVSRDGGEHSSFFASQVTCIFIKKVRGYCRLFTCMNSSLQPLRYLLEEVRSTVFAAFLISQLFFMIEGTFRTSKYYKKANATSTLLRASRLALKLISPVTMSRLPWKTRHICWHEGNGVNDALVQTTRLLFISRSIVAVDRQHDKGSRRGATYGPSSSSPFPSLSIKKKKGRKYDYTQEETDEVMELEVFASP